MDQEVLEAGLAVPEHCHQVTTTQPHLRAQRFEYTRAGGSEKTPASAASCQNREWNLSGTKEQALLEEVSHFLKTGSLKTGSLVLQEHRNNLLGSAKTVKKPLASMRRKLSLNCR